MFPPDGRVLDAGCGVGLDAAWLVSLGHPVVAIDASAGMVAETRRRVPAAEVLQARVDDPASLRPLGAFDGALLDFGVLNCVDPAAAAVALAVALRPGAPLVAVPMPRFNPTWTLSELAHGRPRRVLSRLAEVVDVPVEGRPVRTRYLGGRAVARAFAPWFTLESRAGLGFLLPPPGTRWPEARLDKLASLEARLRTLPLLRDVGDHLLLLLRRTDVAAG